MNQKTWHFTRSSGGSWRKVLEGPK